MTFIERLTAYEKLIRLDKPIGILLLLWPTLWALWLSSRGHPDWPIVWIFVVGTVLMRSAGCAINDYADRNFDGSVARTRDRPLAAGRIKPVEALMVAVVLILASFALVAAAEPADHQLSIVARRSLRRVIHSPNASSPCRRPSWASPSVSVSRWPSLRTLDQRAAGGVDAAGCERVLGHRLRHRIRHGGPGR